MLPGTRMGAALRGGETTAAKRPSDTARLPQRICA